jgi:hypothetical protein
MKLKRLFLFLAILMITSLACGLFGGADPTGVGDSLSTPGDTGSTGAGESSPSPEASGDYDTDFPLPANVENFMKLENGAINYQTSLKLTEVVEFYREAFKSAGYEERDINTVINDTTFSIVWDGHTSGQAIVVQGVDLGNGATNVNVRFEDV